MVTRKLTDETVMSITEVKQNLSRIVNDVARGEGPIVVEKHGLSAAVVISMEDFRRLRDLEDEERKRDEEFTARALDRFAPLFESATEEQLARWKPITRDDIPEDRRELYDAMMIFAESVPVFLRRSIDASCRVLYLR